MEGIRNYPARSRGAQGHQPRVDRKVTLPASCDRGRLGNGDKLPANVRIERRSFGTAVTGPGFYLWDPDHDVAVRSALQLTAARAHSANRKV
jgi:hypothetical protein